MSHLNFYTCMCIHNCMAYVQTYYHYAVQLMRMLGVRVRVMGKLQSLEREIKKRRGRRRSTVSIE